MRTKTQLEMGQAMAVLEVQILGLLPLWAEVVVEEVAWLALVFSTWLGGISTVKISN